MYRLIIVPQPGSPRIRFRYTDSVHAAIVAGLAATGLQTTDLVGFTARPWTFATEGFATGGTKILRAIVVATSDPVIADGLRRLEPAAVQVASSNGDRLNLSGSHTSAMPDPVTPGQGILVVRPLSPFVIGNRRDARDRGRFIEVLDGVDLSAAISAGLTRRLGRPVHLAVRADCLSLAVRAGRAVPVRLRAAKGRDIYVPGFDVPVTLEGSDDDLRAAWYAGIGEKCRYGFGCVALPWTDRS